MTGARIYFGEIVDVQGTTPGPAPTYIVKWQEGIDTKQLEGVRPAFWTWDSLGVDEDGAKTVANRTTVLVIHQANTYAFHFVPAPLVGPCT